MSNKYKLAIGAFLTGLAALIATLAGVFNIADVLDNEPNPVDSTVVIVDTLPVATDAIWHDVLGVVYTAHHEPQIKAKNPVLAKAAQHARYMANGYRLLENERTAWPTLLPAFMSDGHVWNNPKNSTRAVLDRIYKIRENHSGHIAVVVEYFRGEGWPWKGPMPSEVGGSTPEAYEQFGYNIANAMLATLHELPGTYTYELMGELWKRDKLEVRNAYVRGGMAAYVDYATKHGSNKIKVATGALQYNNRSISWAGGLLAESIKDYPADVLAGINKYRGECSINFYASYPGDKGFPAPEHLADSPDWKELPALRDYLKSNYPNITLYASEIGYTSRNPKEHTDIATLVKDRPQVAYTLQRAQAEGDLTRVYYYSVQGTLGKFKPLSFEKDLGWWIEFGQTKIER